MENYIRSAGELLHLDIKAVPGTSKSEIAGVKDGRLRIRIAAAPVDGKANAALISFLAKLLGCARGEITLLRGEKSRLKTLALPGAYREKLEGLASPCFSPEKGITSDN
ncbi:hypothetical protein AGMMS49928_08730 [Spirochaetia bacterium]|nr:hypothetical protein AGMMS49928_08730 [Spirochaetia bacterium]